MSHLLGVDVGTTGARAVVVDAQDGRVVASATSDYPLHTPRPRWAEQDPRDWWRGAAAAIREAVGRARGELGAGLEVAAAGLTGQMHGLVLLDEGGEPTGPSLLWCDARTDEECRAITARIGEDRLLDLVGNPALVGFTAPKLLWLRAHRPEEVARARAMLLPKDYVRFRLTGERATDLSDASGTLLLDVARRRWSPELLAALEIDPALLPALLESTAVSGRLSPQVAAELGLPAGLPVVAGAGDQAAGAVGAGVLDPGAAIATIGSSGVVFAPTAAPVRDVRVHAFCHAAPDRWHTMGVTMAAGLSLRWLRDHLAAGASYEALTAEAAAVPPGAGGLLFAPYLMGERTPHLDPHARGAWVGLAYPHGRGHLVRSVMEGVAYSLRDCLEVMTGLGVDAGEVRAGGGGARSRLWRQILADVLDRDVLAMELDEGPAHGAALLAGTGAGLWGSLAEASAACVRVASRLVPDPAAVACYRDGHARYREIYPRLAPLTGRDG